MDSFGSFPNASHDSWQYHFYSPEMSRFFSVRLWASGSVKKAWSWTIRKPEGLDSSLIPELISELDNCEFVSSSPNQTRASLHSKPGSCFLFEKILPQNHDGNLTVIVDEKEVLRVECKPRCVFFWQVPGQDDGVYHFPNISAEITYEGKTSHAFGYCKRYWGNYDGPWGYQFIHGISEDEKTCVWTADATFGDHEYNYFKIVGEDGSMIQAEKTDTYHNNQRAFWRPLSGPKMELELTECAKKEFFLKSDSQFSKLVERFGTVQLKKDGVVVWSGFGFNEICFGTVA